jgi:hypothetical protein
VIARIGKTFKGERQSRLRPFGACFNESDNEITANQSHQVTLRDELQANKNEVEAEITKLSTKKAADLRAVREENTREFELARIKFVGDRFLFGRPSASTGLCDVALFPCR